MFGVCGSEALDSGQLEPVADRTLNLFRLYYLISRSINDLP